MRKKILAKVLALSLCAVAAAPAVACGGSTGEKIDKTKTQVRVYHYNAGYGDKWVNELKVNFQEKMKDVSFEEGKTGVQVLIEGDMNSRTAERWRAEKYDVLFLESPDEFYGMMQSGIVENLDPIMTKENPEDDNQKIEDKLTAQQQEAYSYTGKDGETHYYGIPHYAGHYGIIYNKDLFDEKGFYIAAERDENFNLLISDSNPVKSVGPDGKTGVIDGVDYTADDGLPRTYDEFFELCIEINARGVNPICWPGKYSHQHVIHCLDNLVANHEGADQMNLNYTFKGTATNLIKLDAQGNIIFDDDGNPVIDEPLEITEDNAYELARQEGKYYAIKFWATILGDYDYYNEADSLDETMLHVTMQKRFLENGKTGKKENAMLIDGVWWQMEADAVFTSMEKKYGEEWSKENREFGWMPLPQATEADAEAIANGTKKTTYMDYLNAVACVKSGLPDGTKAASLELLKYAYTDEALVNFTYTTGTTIGVEYLDKIDYNQLTPYEISLMNHIKNSNFVAQVSGTKFYASGIKNFRPSAAYGSGTIQGIVVGVTEHKMSAEEYFKGHQSFYKGLAW